MSDFLNNPNETRDFEFCRLVIPLSGGEEPRKKEKWLDRAAARPTALRQILIGGSMENHGSEPEFLGGV